MVTRKDLQQAIKLAMHNKHITRQQLADKLHITKQGVSFLINSDQVKYDKLFDLMIALELQVNISWN